MNKNRLRKQKKHFGNQSLRERWRRAECYRSYIGMLRTFGFIKNGDADED
jgi:hypothetical protein